MKFPNLKEAEDFYYGNVATTNDEESKLESWLAEQEIEETKSTIMEEFADIEKATKEMAVEAGIVYPSSVFENDAEEDLEVEEVKQNGQPIL